MRASSPSSTGPSSTGPWFLATFPVAALALTFGLGARQCDPSPGCVVDGVSYPDGTSFPASDGCNTCTCTEGGLACTERGCPGPSCMLDSVGYDDGATNIPAPDGCNTCECNAGVLSCTEQECPSATCRVFGVPYAELAPAPDGCNTCACESGRVGASCTEASCDPSPIAPCEVFGSRPSDPYELGPVTVDGDTLSVEVSYSGGCEPHYFRLCYEGTWLESFPVQAVVRLEHDAQSDPCEAYPTETRQFDLRPLADAYRESYRDEHGTVILRLGGGVAYTF